MLTFWKIFCLQDFNKQLPVEDLDKLLQYMHVNSLTKRFLFYFYAVCVKIGQVLLVKPFHNYRPVWYVKDQGSDHTILNA